MPYPAFMTLHGTRQGLISAGVNTEASMGNGYQSGREDQILVQAFSHNVHVPTGSGVGRRMHRPLIITKGIDKSTPLIYTAMCSQEVLSTCRLEWYRVSAQGTQEHYFTTELEDALIVSCDWVMPHYQDPATAHITMLQKIQISYRRVYWRHEASRTLSCDEWAVEAQA